MLIKDTDIYKLNYFTYNRAFTGSYRNMRYHLVRKKEGDNEALLSAAVYPQPYCWEETAEEKKQRQEFPFTEEGRAEMIAWLNQKLDEFQ